MVYGKAPACHPLASSPGHGARPPLTPRADAVRDVPRPHQPHGERKQADLDHHVAGPSCAQARDEEGRVDRRWCKW
jgi:hypothetical protein